MTIIGSTRFKKRGLWSADIYRRLAAKWTRILWQPETASCPNELFLSTEKKKRGSTLNS